MSHNKPIGCGASGAYAAVPDEEEEEDKLSPHIHSEVTAFMNRLLSEEWFGLGVYVLPSPTSSSDTP